MQTQRIRYPARRGVVDTNLQWNAVRSDSFVAATVSKCRTEGVIAGDHDASRIFGAANLSVAQVVPHDGGVTVRVHIDWDDPLPLHGRLHPVRLRPSRIRDLCEVRGGRLESLRCISTAAAVTPSVHLIVGHGRGLPVR